MHVKKKYATDHFSTCFYLLTILFLTFRMCKNVIDHNTLENRPIQRTLINL